MGAGRITLGLYNSYDKRRFAEAHRRALARAGPLALAFDANLATFGFPYPGEFGTPLEVASWVASGTSIGEQGEYLQELAAAGRFGVFDLPRGGFPPQFGEPVITTRRPSAAKAVSPGEVAGRILGGTSILLLFGLGPYGLPKEVMALADLHLDITQRGLSLETCTALGAVAGILSTLVRQGP